MNLNDKEQTISNLRKLKSFHSGSYGADIDIAIKALKSVTPQPKTGHWIDGVCSECGWDAGQEAFSEDANFCMKCGVKMLPIGAEKE